jgi:hypothetical protein
MRALHPYAMAWYDRLRGEGAGAFDAMRQALPLFAHAPHTRPGDPATPRRALEFSAASRGSDAADGVRQPGAGNGLDLEVELMADMARAHAAGDRTAAQLAAESFPCTVADAVMTAAASQSPVRGIAVQNVRQLGHSV